MLTKSLTEDKGFDLVNKAIMKDRLGDQRGGDSEWEVIKILLQRVELDYVPNSQPRIRT
jgi:hypothetical protein